MDTDAYGSDDEATLTVQLERCNPLSKQVKAPNFPKPKSEGHWLVLGCEAQSELLALKRVTVGRYVFRILCFYTPAQPVTLPFYYNKHVLLPWQDDEHELGILYRRS
eukprot:SAG11_NODE_1965_length_3989_cov_2.106684_2_plen_107_part_00